MRRKEAFPLLPAIILMLFLTGEETAKKNKIKSHPPVLCQQPFKHLQLVTVVTIIRLILKHQTNLKEQWNFKQMYQNHNSKLEKIN